MSLVQASDFKSLLCFLLHLQTEAGKTACIDCLGCCAAHKDAFACTADPNCVHRLYKDLVNESLCGDEVDRCPGRDRDDWQAACNDGGCTDPMGCEQKCEAGCNHCMAKSEVNQCDTATDSVDCRCEDVSRVECGFDQGPGRCTTCSQGQYLENGDCTWCVGCDAGQCRTNCIDANAGECTTCLTGKYKILQNSSQCNTQADNVAFTANCEDCMTCSLGAYNLGCGPDTEGVCTSCPGLFGMVETRGQNES